MGETIRGRGVAKCDVLTEVSKASSHSRVFDQQSLKVTDHANTLGNSLRQLLELLPFATLDNTAMLPAMHLVLRYIHHLPPVVDVLEQL